MDEFQSRRKGNPVFQTQQNLAQQPYLEESRSAIESNVVEMPGLAKLSEESATSRSPQRKTPTKRKTTATSTKARKSLSTSEADPHPFAAELQRLEAQAERINQLLLERVQSVPEQTTAAIDPPTLQAYADRIKQNLAALETAMLVGQRSAPPLRSPHLPDSAPTPSGLPTATAMPPGATPPISPWLPPGQRQQAIETAERLRHLANQDQPPRPRSRSIGIPSSLPLQRRRSRWQRVLGIPRKPLERLSDAVLWVLGAVILRLGCQQLLISLPAVSPVLSIVLLLPAIAAVCLALFVPRAGATPVYRLFLISVGLLIGGRL